MLKCFISTDKQGYIQLTKRFSVTTIFPLVNLLQLKAICSSCLMDFNTSTTRLRQNITCFIHLFWDYLKVLTWRIRSFTQHFTMLLFTPVSATDDPGKRICAAALSLSVSPSSNTHSLHPNNPCSFYRYPLTLEY